MARDVLSVRMSDLERNRLAELAAKDGLTMGEYLRYIIRREAERQLQQPAAA
jgi:predicted DNA-binding protein